MTAQVKDTRTIHERMVAVLGELPAIGKNQKNAQQGFMFRGHDDVLNALNPLLAKHGVFVTPTAMGRELSQRSTKSGSVMFEVSLLIEFTFFGAMGDSVTARVWGEGTDSGDKATSKAHTMAFKTALNQAFAVSSAETADPDSHSPEDSAGRKTPPARPAADHNPPAAGTTPEAPPAGTDGQAAPAGGAPVTTIELVALYKLVREKGGDVEKTQAGAHTAEEQGKLPAWYAKAKAYWEAQPRSFANKVPAKAKATA